MISVCLALMAVQPAIRIEAEDGELSGPRVSTETQGFSGKGYVTDITAQNAKIKLKFQAKAGIYRLSLGYSSPQGPKRIDISVNGFGSSNQVPKTESRFEKFSFAKVELVNGENLVEVQRGWGFYSLDYIEFTPASTVPPLKPVSGRLINPNASPEAKRLMNFLAANYGKRILSGQYEISENPFIFQKTGQWPAVLGVDFMDYSPSREAFGSRPKRSTEQWLSASQKGQVLKLSWHWNAPKDLLNKMIKEPDGRETNALWYKGFYTNATTFDLTKAVADKESEEFKLIIRDIDHIAVELKKLQAANIPVLWRPLHEAEGRWFWWGAKGPEPCIWLWKLMIERLQNHHKINNLIWIWNSVDPAWHPGDEYVDMLAVDAYPSDRRDTLVSVWESLLERFNGKKMLALTEFPGPPDVDRMWRFGVRWSFFVSWTGDLGPKGSDPALVKRSYSSHLTINESEFKRLIKRN